MNAEKIELAILVLNYRTAELTLDCLASLEQEVEASVRVVVVDNASGDDSADRIEKTIADRGWSSWATLLRSPVNGGFAAGNNLGIRSVDAAAYVLLNSDTIVCRGAIAGLRAAMKARPDAGIIGPELLDREGRPDQSFFRDPAPPTELIRSARTGVIRRLLTRYDPILPRQNAAFEPDWLAFACVLIRREVLQQVGLLDEGYFMYFEDVDYCRRVREAGWKVLYWPGVQIVHLVGGSSGVTRVASQLERAPRYYYEARARYFAKFYGRSGLWLANGFWYLGRSVAMVRELIQKREALQREHEALDIWTNALHPLRDAPQPSVEPTRAM